MVTLEVTDLTKVYGTATPLRARLLTDEGYPIPGYGVQFRINGVDYTRCTDENGYASLNINLGIGSYPTRVSHDNIVKNVNVRVTDKKAPWLSLKNLVKTYGDSDPLKVGLFYGANPLPNQTIEFTINGRTYNRTTDNTGYASLNINLIRGVYQCNVRSISDGEYGQVSGVVTVTVKADTMIDATDVTKKFSDPGYFQCAVYDPWQRLNPCSALITVNGVTYTRSTDAEGLIKLNIRLQPGTYVITAKFLGDELHNPSPEVKKTVVVKPDIEEITTVTPLESSPENNQGHVQSHIYHRQQIGYADWRKDEKTKKKVGYVYFNDDTWGGSAKNGWEINFTSYEIDETDPRVKTAKVTTNHYFDLTRGMVHLCITNPFHENFAGQIIDVDYDKKTKLYTYKLQDGRRQYQSKRVLVLPANTDVYSALKALLLAPSLYNYDRGTPNMDEQLKLNPRLLAGLHPLADYDNLKSGTLKFSNKFKETVPQLLSYDSDIDKIMALSHIGGFPTDVWFDTNLICHIDPIDLDKWMNSGIRLRISDLVEYKQSFDTTNIITGINIKDPTQAATNNYYNEWQEFRWLFGANISMIDPVTVQTNTGSSGSTSASNNVTSGIMSGKKIFDVGQDKGIASDYRLDLIKALREKGHTVNDLGVGPNVCQSNGLRASSKGHICIFVANGICCGTHQDFYNNMTRGAYHYDHVIFTWVRGDIEMGRKQAYAWDWYYGDIGLDKSITRLQFFDKHADKCSCVNLWPNGDNKAPLSRSDWQKQVQAVVNGQFTRSNGAATTATTTNNTAGTTAGTTVMDENATYQKALEEVSKSVRDLLSFELKVPLNSPVFKNLHTNMMLWTELPVDFPLANLEEVFKIMPVYKQSRGISSDYRINRWYVEGVKIKCDANGLFATIKLNPFPSSYSSYANAVKSYMDAYNQAFNQKTENTTVNTGGSSSPGTLVKSTGNSELDNKIKGWISGKTSDLDKAIAIHNGLKDYGIRYQTYYNFPKSGGSISKAYQQAHNGLNCGDTSVLTVGSMRAAGLDAYIGFRCDHAHFFTVIVINGTKYYSDLVWADGAYSKRPWNQTWQNVTCHSKYGGVNIH